MSTETRQSGIYKFAIAFRSFFLSSSTWTTTRMSGQPGNGQVVFSATTNSFPILNIPDERYYQYTIDIATSSSSSKKTALSRQKNIQLLHHLQHTVCPRIFNPRIIYDGEALGYCAARLDFSGRPSASVRADTTIFNWIPLIVSLLNSLPYRLTPLKLLLVVSR